MNKATKMRKVKKGILNIGFAALYKVLVMCVGLLIPRLFILNYGSDVNGLQSSIGQIFAYMTLLEAGIGEASLQALYRPISNNDNKGANAILSATTHYYNRIGVIYLVVLVVLAAIYPIFVSTESVSYLSTFLYIIFSGITTGLNFFFVAKVALVISAIGDNYWATILQFFVYILTSASKITLILLGANIVYIQLGYFVVNMLYTAAIYIFAKKKYPWINFKEKPDFEATKQKNSVMVHKISGLVFNNTDILLITFFCDLKTVSIYTIYKIVITSLFSIVSLISSNITFALGQTFAEDKEKYRKLIDAYHLCYTAFSFALYTVTLILYTPFIELYTAGADISYTDAWLPLLFVLTEILTTSREAMLVTITVSGHFKQTRTPAIIETVINLVTSIVGVCLLGIYGVMLGTIAALLYRSLDMNLYANRKILERSPKKTLLVCACNMIIFIAIAIATFFMPRLQINNYLIFALYGIALTVVAMLIYFAINFLFNREEWRYIRALMARFFKKKKPEGDGL